MNIVKKHLGSPNPDLEDFVTEMSVEERGRKLSNDRKRYDQELHSKGSIKAGR